MVIQIQFDLPITQSTPVLGLHFQVDIVPDALSGRQGLIVHLYIAPAATFHLRQMNLHLTPTCHQVAQIVPVASKILALMAATSTAIRPLLLTFGLLSPLIVFPPHQALHFGFQTFIQETCHDARKCSFNLLDDLQNEVD
jgi:hypothetical protein